MKIPELIPDKNNPNHYWSIEKGHIGPGTLTIIDANWNETIQKNFTAPATFAVLRDEQGQVLKRITMY